MESLNTNKFIGEKASPCFCIGRQNNEPFCPCEMKRMQIKKVGDEYIIPEKRFFIDSLKNPYKFNQK